MRRLLEEAAPLGAPILWTRRCWVFPASGCSGAAPQIQLSHPPRDARCRRPTPTKLLEEKKKKKHKSPIDCDSPSKKQGAAPPGWGSEEDGGVLLMEEEKSRFNRPKKKKPTNGSISIKKKISHNQTFRTAEVWSFYN